MSCLLRAGIGSEQETVHDSTPDALEEGLRFGVYEIDCREDGRLYELGRGAMGVTYRATDTTLQRKVALKIIQADIAERSADARERFMREARAAAALRHENIATVHQFGTRLETGQYFYAMELIEGETLDERVRRAGPLDAHTTIAIAQQVTSALAAAEKHGLVHRDLKPANLMLVSPDGETSNNKKLLVKIIDFGLAKAINSQIDPKSLTHDKFVGTPAFASPEQFEHSALDVRSDIYSLGETLWFALTGKTPFSGRSIEEIHRAQKLDVLPIEQLKAAHVPHRLKSLLESMLAFEPASRPGTHELAVRLQRCSPEARKARRTRFTLAAAALLILGMSALFVFQPSRMQNAALNPAPEKSIAVLPFVDLSQAKDQEYFCDGISEELLDSLAKIEGLRVVARTSSFSFKGKNADVKEIAQKLNVQNVLEGSLRRDGNRIRITAQLINARDGYDLWSATFERELQGVFAVQDEITRAIVEKLKVKLALAAPTVAPVNTAAYELYLRGLYLSNKTSEEDLRQALTLFQQALDQDPTLARAWTGVAKVWIWLADEFVKPLQAYPAAEAAANKALALNPHDSEARCHLAEAKHFLSWNLIEAIAETERALADDPNSAAAHYELSTLKSERGDLASALAHIRAAIKLDPLSASMSDWESTLLIRSNRLEEALAAAQRAIKLDPSFIYNDSPLGKVYRAQGKLDEALAVYLRAAETTHQPSAGLALTYAAMGRRAEAQEVLRNLLERRKSHYERPERIARIYAALGEREEAFAWLETAYNEHSSGLLSVVFQPEFRSLQSDPRFGELLRRVGLDPAILDRQSSE